MSMRSTTRPKHRRGSPLPLVVFLMLLAGVVVFRERLLAPFQKQDQPDIREQSSDDEGLVKGEGLNESDSTENLGTSASLTDGRTPDLDSEAVDLSEAGIIQEAALGSDALTSRDVPAETGQAALTSALASSPRAPNTVDSGRTRTGLRSFSLNPAAPVLLDQEQVQQPKQEQGSSEQRAFETAPTNTAALNSLISSLLEEGRKDEALEALTWFTEMGGAGEKADAWRVQLDPFGHARATLMLEAAGSLMDLAALCEEKRFWITEAALLDAASGLAKRVANDVTSSAAAPFETILEQAGERRAQLAGRSDAVKALAAYGAPLPPDADVRSRLRRLAADQRDARAEASGELHEVETRHVRVLTPLGSLVAQRAADVVESVYAELSNRWNSSPWRGRDRLVVEVLGIESTYASRRQAATPPVADWVDAFLTEKGSGDGTGDGNRHLVVLDPRTRGAPLDELWGLLARESARRMLWDQAEDDSARALPLWLEEALVIEAEGTRLLADGSLVFGEAPESRLQQVSASLAGQGPRPIPLGSVLVQLQGNRYAPTWAWSLARFLREARNEDGALRWRDHYDDLLEAPGADEPLLAFQKVMLSRKSKRGDTPNPDNLGVLELEWREWDGEQMALRTGDKQAITKGLLDARHAYGRRDWDECRSLLRRLVSVRPSHPEVLKLSVDLAERTNRIDEALLAAWNLAALRQPSWDWNLAAGTEPQPAMLAEQSARIRYAETIEVQAALGAALAAHDESVRQAVLPLVDDMLEQGFPRAAVRLLDACLSMQPLDAGYLSIRDEILNGALGLNDLIMNQRLQPGPKLLGLSGDRDLFQPEEGGSRLVVRAGDRVSPASLRGLALLEPPYRVSLQLEFQKDSEGRITDDGTRFAGLLFGAPEHSDWGDWGVFATPAGSIEIATPGRLEWPSRSIGRGIRGRLELEVRVEGQRLEILSDGRSLSVLKLGERTAPGWLGLFVRHADVDLLGLTVSRSRRPDPRALWWTSGGG